MYSSAYNISIKKEYMKKIKQNRRKNELKKYTTHNLFSFIFQFPRSLFSPYNFLSLSRYSIPTSNSQSPVT